jgi:hypothetical protein
VVRKLHSGGSRSAAGFFDVRHGRGLTHWLARLLGLPREGRQVPTLLRVTARPGGERWERRFGAVAFVTDQHLGADGSLRERLGRIELRLQVDCEDGVLHFEPAGAVLRIGRWGLPMPAWLLPRISGRVFGDGECARVEIEVRAALLGLLIGYSGSVRPGTEP